jgi:hypothetical protein
LVLLNTLLLLGALELMAALVYARVGPSARRDEALEAGGGRAGAQSSYYDTLPWGEAYWQEFAQAHRNRYRPFYIWRLKPFTGQLINVDSAGLRVTPGAQCGADAYRVAVFGGSTAWGMGSPDNGSIPAHLQAMLSRILRGAVCVTNYAQLGFTSAQDLVQLESELRKGNVPDLALFYGGYNDIATSFVTGQTGVHFDLRQIATAFEEMNRPPPPSSLRDLVRGSNLYRLAQVLVRPPPLEEAPDRKFDFFDSDSLADAVVAAFANHHRQADILARGYGFRTAFFWQPTVAAGAKPLTEEELRSFHRVRDSEFAARVHARARARLQNVPGLYNLIDVFAKESSLVYIDSHHVTPEGNRTLTAAIIERIRDQLPAERLAGAQAPSRRMSAAGIRGR